MLEYEFIIVGEPFSVNRKKKRPEEHNKWKARVAKSAKEVIPVSPTSLPVEVSITTYVTTTTIDVDNVIKPILDGMNGVAYDDDKQVYRVTSERIDLKKLDLHGAFSPLLKAHIAISPEFIHIRLNWNEEDTL